MPVRAKYIVTLVQRLLDKHRIHSAPVPVFDIAKTLGAEVRLEPAGDELCGFLLRDTKNQTAVIGVNSKHHPNRQRFTVGHEIGHYLLHQGERLHIDGIECGLQLYMRAKDETKANDYKEKEANLFAAELLMPRIFLKHDFLTIGTLDLLDEDELRRELKPLADRYKVSTQALTFRLANLEYIRS